jgi:hypothetical protein
MELSITKERVLEAAKTSNDAGVILKALFPEAFELEYIKPFVVSDITYETTGIFIGRDFAPIKNLNGKCVMISKDLWRVHSENDEYITLVNK